MASALRERATAVLIRESKVLLVQGPSLGSFHMPGGGIEAGETPVAAVTRELREETSLITDRADFPFRWDSSTHRHHAFLIEAEGEVVAGEEIDSFLWWDRRRELPLYPHVEAILRRLDGIEPE